jgi:hypothetical protein
VKLLLDENVQAPITSTVKTLLGRSHDIQHVIDLSGWSGTKDLHLYGKAKDAGFEVVVTNDAKQMNRRLEVEAIAKSGPACSDACVEACRRARSACPGSAFRRTWHRPTRDLIQPSRGAMMTSCPDLRFYGLSPSPSSGMRLTGYGSCTATTCRSFGAPCPTAKGFTKPGGFRLSSKIPTGVAT